MNDILNKTMVLVLNRNWRVINTTTPALAFGQMAGDVATGLDVRGPDRMVPVKWADWLRLPVGEQDFSIGTAQGPIRVPTVVVLSPFHRVPAKRPRFPLRAQRNLDARQCEDHGKGPEPSDGMLDHLLLHPRGSVMPWENGELQDRDAERGRATPSAWFIRNLPAIPEWEVFLPGRDRNGEGWRENP